MSPTRDALPRAEPVDLEIHVTTPWGGGTRSIQYMLDSPSGRVGFHKELVAGPTLHNPDEFQRRLFDQIAGLQEGYDTDGHPIEPGDLPRELQSIGNQLYCDLFPRGLRRIYRDDVRDHVETLVITSDEPWIPWEILQPNEDDGEFLCMRYRMTRWLAGATALAPGKRVQRLLGMQAGGDLGGSKTELDYLRSLVADVPGLESEILSSASARSVTEEIEGRGFDLFHFAGHGEVDPSRPGESRVLFEDTAVRARHLTPQAQQLLRKARPLVFFNSCHVGRSGNSLTGLGGWASTWVSQCACSAFVAPLWAVDDHAAELFAATFYWQLSQGSTLGEAVGEGRKVLREQGADSLTWLAYTVYGHPNARFAFGDSEGLSTLPPRPRSASPAFRPALIRGAISHGSERSNRRHHSTRSRSTARKLRRSTTGVQWALVACLAGGTAVSLIGTQSKLSTPPPSSLEAHSILEEASEHSSADRPLVKTVPSEETGGHEDAIPSVELDLFVDQSRSPNKKAIKPAETERARDVDPGYPPLEPIQAGRIGLILFDRNQSAADQQVAAAVELSLLDFDPKALEPLLLESDAPFARAINSGDLSALRESPESPWGLEFLLVSTLSKEPLKRPANHLEAVRVTVRSKLYDLRSGRLIHAGQETHTGAGLTEDQAIEQATRRCLTEVTTHLS